MLLLLETDVVFLPQEEEEEAPKKTHSYYYYLKEIGAVILLYFAGASLHFVYEWSGRAHWVALFGAINESTYEHVKICMWPILLGHAACTTLGRGASASITAALFMFVVNALNRAANWEPFWFDLTLFLLSIIAGQMVPPVPPPVDVPLFLLLVAALSSLTYASMS